MLRRANNVFKLLSTKNKARSDWELFKLGNCFSDKVHGEEGQSHQAFSIPSILYRKNKIFSSKNNAISI